MTLVVVAGTGSYGVHNRIFQPGATECDDPVILEAVRAEPVDWVYLEGDEDVELTEVEVAALIRKLRDDAAVASDMSPLTPPTGSANDVITHISSVESLLAKGSGAPGPPAPSPEQLEQHVSAQESGKLTRDDMGRNGFPCRAGDCDKNFTSNRGRVTHERMKHEFVAKDES